MLTESRKRRRSCDSEEVQVVHQAKRPSGGNALLPELGRDAWDSESSSSDSSGISSPERLLAAGVNGMSSSASGLMAAAAVAVADGGRGANFITHGPCSPAGSSSAGDEPQLCYNQINRILREAHFASLKTRAHPGGPT
ncbi:uncharacterized protein si:dkey-21c1.1 isoform X2 [Engraulis encrasicolus]|uniref:uncharacterized protein si:dkey-21c1.1 isoform X2 n=1 Tax=Engraulis encrasicolus TaxID=184585 RepID=UPI002FD1FD59